MRSSDSQDEGVLPALGFGMGGYDTVPANQGSMLFWHVGFLREVPLTLAKEGMTVYRG